jgi:predicted AlkP superfamily pyrophosphatase or phosphodiesterase
MRPFYATSLFVGLLPVIACAQNARVSAAAQPASTATTTSQPASTPTLVVFFTVDQMRPDYFSRFESQLTGGLARLYHGGAFYTNAFQDHAITETAPGHSATMSGRFPAHNGIVQNTDGVEDPRTPLIGGGGPGASPFRFHGTVLFDWLQKKDPRARALSVSRKDRGAILPLGKAKQSVFWYTARGWFSTSSYYADTLPTWVQQFNDRKIPQTYAGKSWTTLLDPAQYSEPDSVPQENGGRPGVTFPHNAPADPARAAAVFAAFPWMDSLTLQFALDGMQQMKLGAGPETDVLAISLSTTDAVGHQYGPDSREIHDQILRLDRYLGIFFDSLYKLRDSTKIVVALTADHGVAPYPGVKSHDPNEGAGYARPALDTAWAAEARVAAVLKDSTRFIWDTPYLIVDRAALLKKKLKPDSVIAAFVDAERKVPGVLRVDLVRDLPKADTTTDYVARRWLHTLPPGVPVEVVVTLKPYFYWSPSIATHGTPHDYDAHVPVLFYGPPFKPGKYDEFARVVDMAPTLASVLHATPLEKLDGHVLQSSIR